jgi:DNA polymerase-3 subunit delta'
MLIGFSEVKSTLLKHYHNNKLHHAILLDGKKGIGKSSFAKEFVNDVMQNKTNHNPDLLIIEKDADKREIVVDKIRKIADFINQTSAISKDKFIIIDSACELNRSASNALLKVLEEPHANNFIILISHNLNRILPTVKSRCQIHKINDLSFVDFKEILLNKKPNLSVSEIDFLSEICDNSIAQALELGADLIKLYSIFLQSLKNKKLEESFLKIISDKNFSFIIFEKIINFFNNRLIKFSNHLPINFYFNEEEIFLTLIEKLNKEKIFNIVDLSLILLNKTTSLALDKKTSITNIFNYFLYE